MINNMLNKNEIYMNMAVEMSKMSHCQSKQVACLLVKEGRIISTGVNGTPKGYMNCSEVFPEGVNPNNRATHREFSDSYEIHAEQNALLRAAKDGISIDHTIAYCTLKPCGQCTKLLIAAGIKTIIYKYKYDKYSESENLITDEFITANGVVICQI